MSFATQALRYGWVALASLGALTGTTIYVLNNQRHQVKPEDVIELMLGVTERCLATQIGTNPAYGEAPPSFVRTWYSNVYTTNGVVIYTNVVTNTIGWHLDRDMMRVLDQTIIELVPHFVDTNTIFVGSTNSFAYLTVTGLWASLNMPNPPYKFTSTPAWTNPISTNWIVNYTSYWPSTNGTATNICYTSDYRQVVNYAESWTATGGHVWVTSSNWASEVVTVTNAATYNYPAYATPPQIYAEDLQERYKVLNALKVTSPMLYFDRDKLGGGSVTQYCAGNMELVYTWSGAKSMALSEFQTNATESIDNPYYPTIIYQTDGWDSGVLGYSAMIYMTTPIQAPNTNAIWRTNVPYSVSTFVKPSKPQLHWGWSGVQEFNDNGLGLTLDTWCLITNFPFGLHSGEIPVWCSDPTTASNGYVVCGFTIEYKNIVLLADWQFRYCTNKYW